MNMRLTTGTQRLPCPDWQASGGSSDGHARGIVLEGRVTMPFIAHQMPKGLKVDKVVMLGPNETQMGVISGDKT